MFVAGLHSNGPLLAVAGRLLATSLEFSLGGWKQKRLHKWFRTRVNTELSFKINANPQPDSLYRLSETVQCSPCIFVLQSPHLLTLGEGPQSPRSGNSSLLETPTELKTFNKYLLIEEVLLYDRFLFLFNKTIHVPVVRFCLFQKAWGGFSAAAEAAFVLGAAGVPAPGEVAAWSQPDPRRSGRGASRPGPARSRVSRTAPHLSARPCAARSRHVQAGAPLGCPVTDPSFRALPKVGSRSAIPTPMRLSRPESSLMFPSPPLSPSLSLSKNSQIKSLKKPICEQRRATFCFEQGLGQCWLAVAPAWPLSRLHPGLGTTFTVYDREQRVRLNEIGHWIPELLKPIV